MSSTCNLTDRKYHSLYVGNLSSDVRSKELRQYFEQFGEVDQCQVFEADQRRWSNFAFVLMRTPDSINRLMSTRPHYLDNRRLYLKRSLTEQCSNKVEHLITSENVIIQFRNNDKEEIHQPNFNEENIRTYFQTYGNILKLTLLRKHRCVIEYNDYDAVDCIILDAPHYFDSYALQIDKYYTSEQLKYLERMFLHISDVPSSHASGDDDEQWNYSSSHISRHRQMTVRLLNDSIFSVKISNEIKLETIHKGFLATIQRRKELLEQIQQFNKQCQILYEKNQMIKENNRKQFELNQQLERDYQEQIHTEQKNQSQWKNEIHSTDQSTP